MDRTYATAVAPQFPPGDHQHSLNTLIPLLAACPLEVTSKLIVGLEERTFPLQLALYYNYVLINGLRHRAQGSQEAFPKWRRLVSWGPGSGPLAAPRAPPLGPPGAGIPDFFTLPAVARVKDLLFLLFQSRTALIWRGPCRASM